MPKRELIYKNTDPCLTCVISSANGRLLFEKGSGGVYLIQLNPLVKHILKNLDNRDKLSNLGQLGILGEIRKTQKN